MRKIRVVIKQPGRVPYVTNISDRLGNLQEHVGGYIETVTIDEDIVILCNEEGRLIGLPYNCQVLGISFVGTIIFAGVDGEELADLPVDFKTFKKMFLYLWEED